MNALSIVITNSVFEFAIVLFIKESGQIREKLFGKGWALLSIASILESTLESRESLTCINLNGSKTIRIQTIAE